MSRASRPTLRKPSNVSRRPKPTAIKLLEGNPGGRPLNAQEPQPPKGVPEMPKGMGTAAKRHWRVFVRELTTVGVLSIVDGIALSEACVSAALAEKFRNEALKEPMVDEPYFDKEGNLAGYKRKVNPAVPGYLACSKNMKAFLIEFGLTPASRTKLKIDKPKSTEDFPGRGEATSSGDEPDLSQIDETLIM